MLALFGSAAAQAPIPTPSAPDAPRINGPRVFGVRPGAPFLFSVAATGERPMRFAASGLPAGLAIDPSTGRITGSLDSPGEHAVVLRAENALGSAEGPLRIVVGRSISLTPPLGWNSWNCWGTDVSQDRILRSARALVAAGLDRHGWTYINIDDGWQGRRSGPLGALQPNSKFPEMRALAEAVHALVSAEMETVSLKTVYQTLHDLAELGEIAALDVGTGMTRFDPNVDHAHHHLVCRKCGSVRDLVAPFPELQIPKGADLGFEVGSAEIVFRGLCPDCRATRQRRPTRRPAAAANR